MLKDILLAVHSRCIAAYDWGRRSWQLQVLGKAALTGVQGWGHTIRTNGKARQGRAVSCPAPCLHYAWHGVQG